MLHSLGRVHGVDMAFVGVITAPFHTLALAIPECQLRFPFHAPIPYLPGRLQVLMEPGIEPWVLGYLCGGGAGPRKGTSGAGFADRVLMMPSELSRTQNTGLMVWAGS